MSEFLKIIKPDTLSVWIKKNKKAFISYYENNVLKKEVSIKNWISYYNYEINGPDIDGTEVMIENKPLRGFKIAELKQRSSEWFGSGRHVWRIEHPEGFIFEISSENMFAFLENSDIHKGEIQEECVIAFSSGVMSLITTNSDLYQQTFKNKERFASSCKESSVEIGQKIQLKNGTEGYYIGKLFTFIPEYSSDYYSQVYIKKGFRVSCIYNITKGIFEFSSELKIAYKFDEISDKYTNKESNIDLIRNMIKQDKGLSYKNTYISSVSLENDIFSSVEKVPLLEIITDFLENRKTSKYHNTGSIKNPLDIYSMSVFNDILGQGWECCSITSENLDVFLKCVVGIKFDKNICIYTRDKYAANRSFKEEDLKDFYVYRFIGTNKYI